MSGTVAASVAEHLAWATRALAGAGVPLARGDARVLLRHAMATTPEALLAHPERPVDDAAARRFAALVDRRATREPVARLLGEKEFWSLPLGLGPDTLVPRPETETVVEVALGAVRRRDLGAPRILDLGTGSGAILLALLSEAPEATGCGVDVSPGCVDVAARNAARLGLADRSRFVVADIRADGWDTALDPGFELIVSNPPYVADGERAALAPEVREHDPPVALFGGPDGLAFYPAILAAVVRLLTGDGRAVLEVGRGQIGAVCALAGGHGLRVVGRHPDFAGVERVVALAKRPEKAAVR